jgi:hypothetical protein
MRKFSLKNSGDGSILKLENVSLLALTKSLVDSWITVQDIFREYTGFFDAQIPHIHFGIRVTSDQEVL